MAYALKLMALTLALAAPAFAGAAPPKAPAQDQPKYCFQYEGETGSRINRVECKTKAEWAKLGVNVDEMLNK